MSKQRTPAPVGLWNRTTKALGKWIAGMVALPQDRRCTAAVKKSDWNDYPRFPAF